MDDKTVARVLAEEIRTNVRLRREIGLSEGDESGVVLEEGMTGVYVTTSEGQTFVLGVGEVTNGGS